MSETFFHHVTTVMGAYEGHDTSDVDMMWCGAI